MRIHLDIPISEIEHLIDEWIYSERDREILKRRLIDGITYEKIAEEFDLSTKRTSDIIYAGIQRVVAKLPQKYTKDI